MRGTQALPALDTSALVSGQPCDVGTYGWNVFNELLEGMLILELRATAVWAGAELDLNILIDMIGLAPEGARMPALAPRSFGRDGAFCGSRRKGAACRCAARSAASRATCSSAMRFVLTSSCWYSEAIWTRRASTSGASSAKRSAWDSAAWSKRSGSSRRHCLRIAALQFTRRAAP